MVLLFPSRRAATACVDYVTQPQRSDGKDSLAIEEVKIRVFLAGNTPLFGVFFPVPKTPLVMPFWQTTGTGISSRAAEDALGHMDSLKEIGVDRPIPTAVPAKSILDLEKRITEHVDRAPITNRSKVSTDDVYLFQTGMAAIFYVHNFLLKARGDLKTIQFGVPFHQTRHIFKFWGPGFHFFPLATELDDLDKYLTSNPVLGIWTEIPTNPLLVTPDLHGLRAIANKHKIPLIIDDTVGSFCSVDVLGIADIVITSLTKSFSGYADVMGGSAILNKDSILYPELKVLFKDYHGDLFPGDAAILLQNSSNYLERSTKLNKNAEILVNFLQSFVSNPSSSVTKVFYPTVSPTLKNYNAVKRSATQDFTPGYGCLFSVDFKTLDQAIAFYNNLHFHQGPHLGAHRTLCVAYVKVAYDEVMPGAEAWGLRPSQIRISTGLEDAELLLATVKHALTFADAVKADA